MASKILAGKIALVTGASRGIGAAVAKRFAKEGAHVLITARTVGGLEEVDDAIRAEGGSATIIPFDLKEYEKIDQLGGVIAKQYGRLDILVGNAGVLGHLSPLPHSDPKTFEKVFNINLIANFRLIRSFDTLLQASEAGRAMFVTSGVTQGLFPFWGAYAASKAALENMILNYAAELEATKVKVNLIDPGEVDTRMHAEAMPGANPKEYAAPEAITDIFVELASVGCNYHGNILQAQEYQASEGGGNRAEK